MKVTATAVGFHGKIRQPGETFDVADGTKGSWFLPAEKAEVKATGGKQGTARQTGGQPGGNDLV